MFKSPSVVRVQENTIQNLASKKVSIHVLWPHQFLQAFFFLPAPSPQVGALRELGSGFLKSSSSKRASESTRSCKEAGKQSAAVTTVSHAYRSAQKSIAHQIVVIHVIGGQHPHFNRVGVQSRFVCWNDRCQQALASPEIQQLSIENNEEPFKRLVTSLLCRFNLVI